MTLKALLSRTRVVNVQGDCEAEVSSLSLDSRTLLQGGLFFAVSGQKEDGLRFVKEAVGRGAVGVVAEHPADARRGGDPLAPGAAAWVHVPEIRESVADLASAFYENPSENLKVVGVTGTNGKTTTSFLVKHICDQALLRCGLVGTVRYAIGEETLPASRTTPDAIELQGLLARMRDSGCKSVAMEVSSHAIHQKRARAVHFDAVVFTNLTQDHLDYHTTMEAYFEVKASLLMGLNSQRFKQGTAVVNVDDNYGQVLVRRLRQAAVPTLTFGTTNGADFRASAIKTEFQGSTFQLDAVGKSWLVRSPLIGRFNVLNAVGAIAAAHAVGVPVRDAVLAMATAPSVPGRMEPVPGKRAFRVFVDYAHTEDALRNALKTLRELQPQRLITVFGCGGDRDRGKRSRMGAVAEELADWAVVTSDNPRGEAPEAIAAEIVAGMRRGQHEVILDRAEAIRRAVALAQPRDIVLVAGKGHETTQVTGAQSLPFSDLSVARSAVEERPSDFGR